MSSLTEIATCTFVDISFVYVLSKLVGVKDRERGEREAERFWREASQKDL